jgi:PDZ domain
MSGPKHLWSGDWREESAAARAAAPPAPAAREPVPPRTTEPPAAEPRSPRRPISPKLRRRLPIALAAAVLVGVAAWAITALAGSSPGHHRSAAGVPRAPLVTPASIQPRPVYWLGMQIETVAPGAAVVDTVRSGSPGELAGLSPGDLILSVNGRSIQGASDIAGALQGLKSGDHVVLQISHGSALFSAEATLTAPPSDHP